ncbi:MAG: PilZ domain-containing protein [Planctomycetota bacterium]|jgi:hypothetical protein
MKSKSKAERRNAVRRRQFTPIEFIVEGDLVAATTVDVSETGLSITTNEPLNLTVRFQVNNQAKVYQTKMVWAKREEEGGMTYGLEFLEPLKSFDS